MQVKSSAARQRPWPTVVNPHTVSTTVLMAQVRPDPQVEASLAKQRRAGSQNASRLVRAHASPAESRTEEMRLSASRTRRILRRNRWEESLDEVFGHFLHTFGVSKSCFKRPPLFCRMLETGDSATDVRWAGV